MWISVTRNARKLKSSLEQSIAKMQLRLLLISNIPEISSAHAAISHNRSRESMGQPSWNIGSQGTKSVAYTLSTAALDVAEGLEADLVSKVAEVAAVTKDGADEPITEDTLLTALV